MVVIKLIFDNKLFYSYFNKSFMLEFPLIKLKNIYVYNFYEDQFFFLIFFLIFCFFLTLLLLLISIMVSSKKSNFEKNSPYECGFEPFGDSHLFFNISFFIVGILFLIFDLELIFILPWAVALGNLPIFSFWLMIYFIILFVVGFIYEWKKGALDWL